MNNEKDLSPQATSGTHPSRAVASELARNHIEGTVPDVSEFRIHRSLRQKLAQSVIGRGRIPEDQYDRVGYERQLAQIVKSLVRANDGVMSDGLYDAAEQASTYFGGGKNNGTQQADYYSGSSGVESAGVVNAILHNRAFIETDPKRAVAILSSMGEQAPSTYTLFTHGPRGNKSLNRDYGYEYDDPDQIRAFDAFVHEDALWGAANEDTGSWDISQGCVGAILSLSEALNLLARSDQEGTRETRVTMLIKNDETMQHDYIQRVLVESFAGEPQLLGSLAESGHISGHLQQGIEESLASIRQGIIEDSVLSRNSTRH